MKLSAFAVALLVTSCNAGDVVSHRSGDADDVEGAAALAAQARAVASMESTTRNTTDIDLALSVGMKALDGNLDPDNGAKPFFEVYALSADTVSKRLSLPVYPADRTPKAGQRFAASFVSNVTGRNAQRTALGH